MYTLSLHDALPILLVAEHVIPRETLQIAVEDDADEFAGAVYHRAAGVAADDVSGADEVKRRFQIEARLALLPQRRQVERRLVLHFLRAFVKRTERRKRGHGFVVLLVAFYDAKGEAQGERGVGITRRSEQRVAGARNRRERLLLDPRL